MTVYIQTENNYIKNINGTLKKIASWICKDLKLNINSLAIIFITDTQIKELHKRFLGKSVTTDVITFNLGDSDLIEGEIYISLDKAKKQAKCYGVSLINEISRLITHSCLHLSGYNDNNEKTREIMKKKENIYVATIQDLFIN